MMEMFNKDKESDTDLLVVGEKKEIPHFENYKIRYCEKLEERIYVLLKTDNKKAGEELLYLALQVARIVLLKNKTVPKTKYDIAEQVKPFDKILSRIIKELLDYIKACMKVIS